MSDKPTKNSINVDKFTWKPGDIVITKKGNNKPSKTGKQVPIKKW